jgi:tetratricopeptide (TPR) repeat protein
MSETPAALVEKAMALHRSGAIEEAATHYREALRQDPHNADALYHLARVACQQERFSDGIDFARKVLAIAPERANAHNLLGMALQRVGRRQEALASFDRAVALAPELGDAHGNRGNILVELGRTAEALTSFERAVALKPNSIDDWCNHGAALADLGRHEDAIASYERAITLDPDLPGVHYNRAKSLVILDRTEDAVAGFDRALAIAPDFVEAHSDRALVLKELGRFDEALAGLDRAVGLRPDFAEGITNRGHILGEIGRSDAAETDYARALSINPWLGPAHLGRAHLMLEQGRLAEARATMERARALDPQSPEPPNSLGLVLLLTGDWEEGFRNYEYRGKKPKPAYRSLPYPRWNGEPLPGGRLILLAEQGLGDAIQFSRFGPLLVARGFDVSILPFTALVPLFADLDGVKLVISTADLEHDPRPIRWIPMMSIPGALGLTPATVPANVPYLRAEPARVAAWADRLGSDGFKIGIAWHTAVTRDWFGKKRSFPLVQLAPLAAIPGVRLISLQKGAGLEEIAQVPFASRIETLGEDFDAGPSAFLDTAAVMMSLDLIVCCDTSVGHLAGALARPVFVALPFVADWRWLRDRDDSPWYPTMRLFRQTKPGEWGRVLERVAQAVREMF